MAFDGVVADAPCTADLPALSSFDGDGPRLSLDGRVLLWLSTPVLLAGVLGRVARGMAARAHFSVDSIEELSPLTDRLGAHAHAAAADQPLKLALSATTRRLELAIGPFRNGSSSDLDTSFGGLVAGLEAEQAGDSETLRLVVSESRS
jgi:hypothetical protein